MLFYKNIFDLDVLPDSIFNRQLENDIKMNSKKDSYYLCSNGFAMKLISKYDDKIVGRPFINLRSFYKTPIKSKLLEIFISDGLSSR